MAEILPVDPLFDAHRETTVMHGRIGAGKTTASLTISQYWPADYAQRIGKSGKIIDLKDTVVLLGDQDGTAALSVAGITVDTFDVIGIMSRESLYKPLGFKAPPSLMVVLNLFLLRFAEQVRKGEKLFCVVSSLTGLDTVMFSDALAQVATMEQQDPSARSNPGAAYMILKKFHTRLSIGLRLTAGVIVYECHSVEPAEEQPGEKRKSVGVRVVGASRFVPDIQGQNPKFYLRNDTLELFVKAVRGPGGVISRSLLTDVNTYNPEDEKAGVHSGAETKNRYAGVLNSEEPANLRAAYAKIRAAQGRWTHE
jgi:hypothetical protein